MSVHRFLTGDRNLIRTAVLSALNTQSSSAIRRTAVSRSGNGRIGLTGPYTGDEDTQIDVEITAGGGSKRITEAAFTGVGTGTITDRAVDVAATAQQYTVELIDLGTRTQAAETDIESASIAAKTAGAAGNAINISVDQSGITFTATDYSLLEDLDEGTEEIEGGVGWDWGTAVAFNEDDVPTAAKRIAIGSDRNQVYRQWKVYRDGEWVYRFLPAIRRTYKAGARIYEVTGSRTVTLTDGVTPEVYTSVVTLYDLLSQIKAGSALVDVDGVISGESKAENLAAVADLRTRTDARVDWTSGEGSEHATGFINHSAAANASTEIVTARCVANTKKDLAGIGREVWTLRGSVSGDLGRITTGEAYNHPAGKFALTIPTRLPPGFGEPRGEISADVEYVGRGSGETEPPICVDRMRLGPNAEDKSIRFVYRPRPTDECACGDTAWSRLPRADECLGIEETTEDDMTSSIAAGYAVRIEEVQHWHKTFVAANTSLDNAEIHSAIHDIDLADKTRSILLECLQRVYLEGVRSWTPWWAAAAITRDVVREPSTANGYKYRAQNAGTTHASTEPTWPTTRGSTVADNGITWECMGQKPEEEFDAALTAIDADLTALEAIETNYADFESIPVIAASTAYTRGTLVRSSASGGGSPFSDAIWVCIDGGTTGTLSEVNTAYPIGVTYYSVGDEVVRAQEVFGRVSEHAGASTEPLWMCLGKLPYWSNADINHAAGQSSGISFTVADFVQRYKARADYVLTQAELIPNFSDASGEGLLSDVAGACWRDTDDSNWWVPEGHAYLPAFTNQEYVSVKKCFDEQGNVLAVPTHEFGFVIKVQCPGDLKEGDMVIINIGDAGWPNTYQIDDKLHLATVSASPLYLGGGVDGDDTLTWSVVRSVDGAGADYSMDLTTPALYDDGDVQFRINAGGIDYALEDRFVFCVEAGTFKWRQDAGSWSADLSIGTTVLADGLSATFAEGACPSFVLGDTASFLARQPYAVDGLAEPTDSAFTWSGAGTTITATITGDVDAIGLLIHSLPAGSTVLVEDGVALSESMVWREGPMVLLLDSTLTDPTLTFTIASATGGSVGWLWAGEAINLYPSAPTQTRTLSYSMIRGAGGLNAQGTLAGKGKGVSLEWIGFLRRADISALTAAVNHAKSAGDEPICCVPQTSSPEDAMLVKFPDDIEYSDFRKFQPASAVEWCVGLSMGLAAWLT